MYLLRNEIFKVKNNLIFTFDDLFICGEFFHIINEKLFYVE